MNKKILLLFTIVLQYHHKEALSIDEDDDKIPIVAFTNGLRKGKFLFSLYKTTQRSCQMYFIRLLSI